MYQNICTSMDGYNKYVKLQQQTSLCSYAFISVLYQRVARKVRRKCYDYNRIQLTQEMLSQLQTSKIFTVSPLLQHH